MHAQNNILFWTLWPCTVFYFLILLLLLLFSNSCELMCLLLFHLNLCRTIKLFLFFSIWIWKRSKSSSAPCRITSASLHVLTQFSKPKRFWTNFRYDVYCMDMDFDFGTFLIFTCFSAHFIKPWSISEHNNEHESKKYTVQYLNLFSAESVVSPQNHTRAGTSQKQSEPSELQFWLKVSNQLDSASLPKASD